MFDLFLTVLHVVVLSGIVWACVLVLVRSNRSGGDVGRPDER